MLCHSISPSDMKATTFGLSHGNGEAIDRLKGTFFHVVSTAREVGRVVRSRVSAFATKTLIVQNRFHPNQAPTKFENKFVFNWQVRAGRYFYGYRLPMQCRTPEGSAICRTACFRKSGFG
jgi:hypothetical protein